MHQNSIAEDVARALAEDVGGGDLTGELIPAANMANASVITREPAVICGREWFDEVFRQVDPATEVSWQVADGEHVAAGTLLCQLHGHARAILTGERTALNFLQTLSATATTTAQFVEKLQGTRARLLDTRKTLPGFRLAQKYAVRCGGGHNHRIGLYDAILIKENHIIAAGSISNAVGLAKRLHPQVKIEVEVETLDELAEALACAPSIIMLDNFSLELMREAVIRTDGRIPLEASGNVNLNTLRAIAETGVDYISVGHITKDISAIDLSMRFA
ncbi:carboxylating nicotinate-nucleotide diphosphorylase [Plasticicumulans acidivorans]|uniref:Probable nicotinate-nucleotide pyrophosphorylase [carboxylating] n=1 Tax=Plasticicumulans acidivorans TaxID=886464 RepID=A0A317MRR1_9GAMM|nr:carboxylating nicotinate-nucleotide diphosphorylase [Plasticicumulans acidivorans]PWV59565.1 nicotinate-nucleotide pyrophosphorylase [carboxylating] [Plasticicumulans acidivorans]